MPFLSKLRSGFRQALESFSLKVLEPILLAAARCRTNENELPISVHMLVSSKTWKMGIMAAYSFEFFTGKRWQFVIHEDGSMDQITQQRIRDGFPGCRVIRRSDANRVVTERLLNYPTCLRNRSQHNLFLKVFDSPAFAPNDRFVILDSDLLFYRRPAEILRWVESGGAECWFNQDLKEGYSSPGAQIEKKLNLPLWDRVNSGLCLLHKAAFSLDLSERFLTECEADARKPGLLEQTLFAVNASSFNRGGMLSAQYEISERQFRRPDAVCRHYLSTNKWTMLYLEGPPSLVWLTLIKPLFS